MSAFYNAVMEKEAKEQWGSDYYERCEKRTYQRNGYRERTLKNIDRCSDIAKASITENHIQDLHF